MFNEKNYIDLINYLLKNNLKPSIDWNKKDSVNHLLIRHDIDFSLSCADRLSLIESELGIKSTYFFMLSSNMYNLMSKESRLIVENIKARGHKLSLHFDPTSYRNEDSYINEKSFFEDIFDVTINIISIHRPGKFLANRNLVLFGCNQTYNDKYFREMHYVSDSGGKDVFPSLKKYFSKKNRTGLQLLIHPIWWIKKESSPTKTLNFWLKNYVSFIKKEISKNCKTYEA